MFDLDPSHAARIDRPCLRRLVNPGSAKVAVHPDRRVVAEPLEVGGGVEVALTPRSSGFMEILGIGELGAPLFDADFRGGINIHLDGMFH